MRFPTPFGLCVLSVLAASLVTGCRHVPATDAGPGTSLIGGPEAEAELEGPAFPGWAEACGGGDEAACRRLYASTVLAFRHDVARSPGTVEGLERGCDTGVADACGGAAIARSIRDEDPIDEDALARACSLGSAWSCAMSFNPVAALEEGPEAPGIVLQRGIDRCREVGDVCAGVAGALESFSLPAEINATEMLKLGCAHEESLSCYLLGVMHAQQTRCADAPSEAEPSPSRDARADVSPGADGSAQDSEASASPASDASCANAPRGSAARGKSQEGPAEDGPSGAQAVAWDVSAEDARRALTIACDGDIGPACHLLSMQLFRGEGGPADPRRARARSRQACGLGDREACDFLARTRGGRTFPPPEGAEAYPDEESYVVAQRRYCELGGLGACVRLAETRVHAGSTAPDLTPIDEGLTLLVRSCTQKSDEACDSLRSLVGRSTAACRSGRDATACLVAGAIWRRGLEVPASVGETIDRDPVRAREAFDVACQAGRQAACSELNSGDDGDSTSK